MYDLEGSDSGREWLEVSNSSAEDIDLTKWKLFEAKTNHGLKAVEGHSSTIPAGGYAVVVDNSAKFKVDWPSYTGPLLDSAFSLSNTGETLVLRNEALVDIDSLSYTSDLGAKGDGNSLSLVSGSLKPAIPSPGAVNLGEVIESDTGNGDQGNHDGDEVSNTNAGTDFSKISAHSGGAELSPRVVREKVLAITAGRDRLLYEGVEVRFSAITTLDGVGHHVSPASIIWSMGDGASARGAELSHDFAASGDYVVVVRVKSNGHEVVDRVNVRVIPVDLTLGVESDTVLVTNNSKYELNLGGFVLRSGGSSFIIPQDTIVLAKSTLAIARKVSGLSMGANLDSKLDIALLRPDNVPVAKFVPVLESGDTGQVLGASREVIQEDDPRISEALQLLEAMRLQLLAML